MTDPVVPQFGSLHRISKDGWEGVPDGPNPFYLGASDGLFIHKRMLTGRGLAKIDFWPTTFPKFGNSKGSFNFEADPIPAQMMGQVVNFFERIYDRQHTEAAVLLVMHAETKEWRIFVPTQLLSHGGVNYVFDPAHIQYPWVIVGSIHSHCDFGASHSSTDTGDAADFDGLHCTIGLIKRPIPQIVAMMAMNKQLFHYKDEQFPFLFNYSETKQHEAPAWWDRYCEDTVNKVKPVGYDLYAKFNKPTVIKPEKAKTTITQIGGRSQSTVPAYGFNPDAWVWDPARHIMVKRESVNWPPLKVARGQGGLRTTEYIPGIGYRPLGADSDDWDDFYRLQGMDGPPDGYEGYDPETLMKRGYVFDPERRTWVWTSGRSSHGSEDNPGILKASKDFNRDSLELQRWIEEDEKEFANLGFKEQTDLFWEDVAGKELLDILFDSLLINDEDIDFAIGNPKIAGDKEYWKDNILRKVISGISVLTQLGLGVELVMGRAPEDMALLPERATPPPDMRGVH